MSAAAAPGVSQHTLNTLVLETGATSTTGGTPRPDQYALRARLRARARRRVWRGILVGRSKAR
jgi:hypothetical protein